jgi:hypothetical protein
MFFRARNALFCATTLHVRKAVFALREGSGRGAPKSFLASLASSREGPAPRKPEEMSAGQAFSLF